MRPDAAGVVETRLRTSEVVRPVVHQGAPLLEQVAAAAGGLHAVCVGMGQGELADLARGVVASRAFSVSRDLSASPETPKNTR